MLLVYKDFEWDLREAADCLTAHGVSFREASTVFADKDVLLSEGPAPDQLRAVGRSSRGRMLVVVHKGGRRIRILGARMHTNDAADVSRPEPGAATPAEPSAPSPRAPATGWTAETYGIYWDAYSAARQAARREGKSPREAQRLGREAGERAMAGRAKRSPKPSAHSST